MVDRTRHPALDPPAVECCSCDLEDLGRGQDGLNLRVLTWNICHGRGFPRDFSDPKGLRGDGPRQAAVDRSLLSEFTGVLKSIEWDFAFLQECPPRWVGGLARETASGGWRAPTARNWMSPVTGPIAERRPGLIGSWEGGSNAILIRGVGGRNQVLEVETETLSRLPERRAVLFIALSTGLCLANFHASTGRGRAERDVLAAARSAADFAGGRPLVFGGDFNCRPISSDVFRQMEWEFSLAGAEDREGIDHLLSTGGPVPVQSDVLPDRVREVTDRSTGRGLRLSDHPVVVSLFSL